MVAAVEISDPVFAGMVALFVVFVTGSIGAIGWTVSLLWRTTNQLSRIEATQDDHERRLTGLEAK